MIKIYACAWLCLCGIGIVHGAVDLRREFKRCDELQVGMGQPNANEIGMASLALIVILPFCGRVLGWW